MIRINSDDFYEHGLTSLCVRCKHLDVTMPLVCAAFPEGIPREIWVGEANHREPYPGDNGIQYEYRPFIEEENPVEEGIIRINDRDIYSEGLHGICADCKHWSVDGGILPTCTAFPEGIPLLIWVGEVDHRVPYPGDNGIQFEQRIYTEEEIADAIKWLEEIKSKDK